MIVYIIAALLVFGVLIAVELAGLAPRPKQPPHGILDARTA